MNTYDFVHLAVWAVGGKVRGKTKLQKTMYFLGRLAGCLDELGYRAHYYGPYSPEVAEAADRLLSLGFIDQTIAGGGAYDSRGFEVARYDFSLNDKGSLVAELKAKRSPEPWKRLTRAAEILKKAGDPDYMELSVAAKTDFMLDQKDGKATVGELAKLAGAFGWEVKPEEVLKAGEFLQSLGLIKVSQ